MKQNFGVKTFFKGIHMKRKHRILIFILLSIILVGIYIPLSHEFEEWYVVDKTHFDIAFTVQEGITGFNLNPGIMHFGTLPPGSAGIRDAYLTNEEEFPIKVDIRADGTATQFIQVSDNNFIIQPHELKNLTFTVPIPIGVEQKYYYANITVIYTRTFRNLFIK